MELNASMASRRLLLVGAADEPGQFPDARERKHRGVHHVIERQGRPTGAGIALTWLARSRYRLARPMVVSRWPQQALRALSAVTGSYMPGPPQVPGEEA